MITDTFENLTEEIIKVTRNENAVKVDACILTFSHVILKYVLENYECKKIGDLFSSNGANPVYGFEYQGRYFAIYMTYVGGQKVKQVQHRNKPQKQISNQGIF